MKNNISNKWKIIKKSCIICRKVQPQMPYDQHRPLTLKDNLIKSEIWVLERVSYKRNMKANFYRWPKCVVNGGDYMTPLQTPESCSWKVLLHSPDSYDHPSSITQPPSPFFRQLNLLRTVCAALFSILTPSCRCRLSSRSFVIRA